MAPAPLALRVGVAWCRRFTLPHHGGAGTSGESPPLIGQLDKYEEVHSVDWKKGN